MLQIYMAAATPLIATDFPCYAFDCRYNSINYLFSKRKGPV